MWYVLAHAISIHCTWVRSGPWKQIQRFKADCIGPEDMLEPAESQDFKGFYETARVSSYILTPHTFTPSHTYITLAHS